MKLIVNFLNKIRNLVILPSYMKSNKFLLVLMYYRLFHAAIIRYILEQIIVDLYVKCSIPKRNIALFIKYFKKGGKWMFMSWLLRVCASIYVYMSCKSHPLSSVKHLWHCTVCGLLSQGQTFGFSQHFHVLARHCAVHFVPFPEITIVAIRPILDTIMMHQASDSPV